MVRKGLLFMASFAISCTSIYAREDVYTLLKEDITRSMNLHHNYEAPSKIVETPAPRGYKPFYISHYGRHGSRYHWTIQHLDRGLSLMDTLYVHNLLTDEGKSVREDLLIIKEAHKGQVGYLTHKGALQHQGIAHRMYERYPAVFNSKSRDEVYAVATAAQRCIQSMANFCVQLARENPDLQFTMDAGERFADYLSNTSGLKSQGDSRVDFILDSLLRADLNPERIMREWVSDEDACTRYIKDQRKFIYYVFWAGGIGQCLDIEDPFIYRHFNEDEIYALWEYNDAYYYTNMCGTIENGRNRDLIGKRILVDIVSKADEAMNEKSKRGADLRFGHDSALSPLMSLLRVDGLETEHSVADAAKAWYGFESMPMASNLQLIFYKNRKGEVLVKLFFNEKEITIPSLASECGPYYRWENLREYFMGLIN